MTTLSPDTRPEAERVQIELLRQAPAWRKLHLLAQMNSTVRTFAMSGLRQRYPHASPAELRRRLADLWLGPELAAHRRYGPAHGATRLVLFERGDWPTQGGTAFIWKPLCSGIDFIV